MAIMLRKFYFFLKIFPLLSVSFLIACGGEDSNPSPHSAPILYAESVDKGAILYWEGVDSSSSVILEWSETEKFDKPVLLAENLVDPFLHTGLENGSQNFYKIRVLSLDGSKLQSSIVEAIPASGLRINISTIGDVERKRRVLKKYIWGDAGKPTNSKLSIEKEVTDTNYEFLKPNQNNLAYVDRYKVAMPYGADANEQIESIAYHFHPLVHNGEAFIYHSGHGGGFRDEDRLNEILVIPYLISRGYAVIAFSMPLQDRFANTHNPVYPGTNVSFTQLSTLSHEELFLAFGKDFFHFFFDPLSLVIDHLQEEYDYKRLYMMGLSGGAWTTTVYSAIDTRIDFSYPVSGSIPIPYRPPNYGDIEQLHPVFYAITTYEELYLMASIGSHSSYRQHIQILNNFDPIFAANDFPYWEWEYFLKNKMTSIADSNGRYGVYIEEVGDGHYIRKNTLDFILDDIRRNPMAIR
jgi:hypothetical protein